MRRAREQCDVVVVSLFVNPAQFNEAADLESYPRDEARDAALAEREGVDFLFAPRRGDVPARVCHHGLGRGRDRAARGRHRGRAHFDGVATVVTKLLNIVGPDVAYFGQKDAQQAIVIGRLVPDLDMPVRIEVCPTVREPDGLAMSSRNVLLSPDQRPVRPRCTARCGRSGRGRRRRARSRGGPDSALAELTSPGSSSSTSSSFPQTRWRRCSGSTAKRWRSSPPGSAPRD